MRSISSPLDTNRLSVAITGQTGAHCGFPTGMAQGAGRVGSVPFAILANCPTMGSARAKAADSVIHILLDGQRLLVRQYDLIAPFQCAQQGVHGFIRRGAVDHDCARLANFVNYRFQAVEGLAQRMGRQCAALLLALQDFSQKLVREAVLRLHDCAAAVAHSQIADAQIVLPLVKRPLFPDLTQQGAPNAAQPEKDEWLRRFFLPVRRHARGVVHQTTPFPVRMCREWRGSPHRRRLAGRRG